MPIYSWQCEKCQAEKDTIVSISESDVPPETQPEEPCQHEWARTYKHAPAKKYGAGWNTRKGYH